MLPSQEPAARVNLKRVGTLEINRHRLNARIEIKETHLQISMLVRRTKVGTAGIRGSHR